MFKLLLSTALAAPVIYFTQFGTAEAGLSFAKASASWDAEADTSCRSETLGVSFHDTLLSAHSAEEIGLAFTGMPGCEVSFVRLTALVPEMADDFDREQASARQAELAAHIEALVGAEAARDLPMATALATSRLDGRLRQHALLRIERRPDAPGAADVEVAMAAGSGGSPALHN